MSVQSCLLGSSLVKPEDDVSASGIVVGGTFSCQLERMTDCNCIALWVDNHSMLGHLTREGSGRIYGTPVIFSYKGEG